jgi:RNA polymerase sigma factor, sigma-70 family
MLNTPELEALSDEDLVVLALKSQDNFALIINRYKSKLFNYIRRITNVRDEDAEDLLQDVFLKVYLNLNDFDTDLKFSSWIYAIAHNQVISQHRKISVRAEGHSTNLEDESARKLASNINIEQEVDNVYLKDNINKVLDALPEKYRDILVLKFLEEKNYQEISDILKKPVGTVGSLMNKAKSEFKKELAKQQIKL